MVKTRAAPVKTVNFEKMLWFILSVALATTIIAFAFTTIFVPSDSAIIWAISLGVLSALIGYPLIVRYCSSKAFLILNEESLTIEKVNEQQTDIINWKAIDSYQIKAFESLLGSGFTLTISLKNKNFYRLCVIGVNLSDKSNLDNRNSIIFRLMFNIIRHNKRQEKARDRIIFAKKIIDPIFLVSIALLIIVFIIFNAFFFVSILPNFLHDIVFLFLFVATSGYVLHNRLKKDKELYRNLRQLDLYLNQLS